MAKSIPDHLRERYVPKVSIGMPVYNGGKYIRQAIDSLLIQTFSDFELIISDNASTDDTEAICQEYVKKDSRIRFFRQPENMGDRWNFWFVFEEAKGDYFMWAAADDMWSSNWIERLLKNFSDNVCVSMGKMDVIGTNNEILTQYHYPNLSSIKLLRLAQYFLWNDAWKVNLIYGLYKRSILYSNRIDFFHAWGDFGIDDNRPIFLVLQFGQLTCDFTACYFKREHPESLVYELPSPSFLVKILNMVIPYKKILGHCSFLGLPIKWDVKIMLIVILPIDIVRIIINTYKNLFIHLFRKIK